jgi:hypothetical protein
MQETIDIWRKGRVIDMWSIPHFLFGILFAFVPYAIPLSLLEVFLIMVGIALIWELGEYMEGIRETIWNNIADVILPIISYFLASHFLITYGLLPDQMTVLFVAVLMVYIFTNISGWLAYRRRVREFMH